MDFYERMRLVCQAIPHGRVATYGQIALLCGKPRNARQVGYALSHRLAGCEIPAHRVVNSSGFLSGACAFDGQDTQRKLLRSEGVRVSVENTVDLTQFGWNHTYEDALAFRDLFEKRGC